MAEEDPIMLTQPTKGSYTGNGTSQSIITEAPWTHIHIVSTDRKYIVDYYMADGQTIAMAAVGAGDQYRIVKALDGGISVSEEINGFSVGSHVCVNENEKVYYWSVD